MWHRLWWSEEWRIRSISSTDSWRLSGRRARWTQARSRSGEPTPKCVRDSVCSLLCTRCLIPVAFIVTTHGRAYEFWNYRDPWIDRIHRNVCLPDFCLPSLSKQQRGQGFDASQHAPVRPVFGTFRLAQSLPLNRSSACARGLYMG